MSPRRVQRTRGKGGGIPEGAIYIGRPSRYCNRYKIVNDDGQLIVVLTDKWGEENGQWAGFCAFRDAAVFSVELFARARLAQLRHRPKDMVRYLADLEGRDVACWCALDAPCHGDILIILANGGGEVEVRRYLTEIRNDTDTVITNLSHRNEEGT